MMAPANTQQLDPHRARARTLALHPQKPVALITGAAGFIGSHLAEQLITEGYHVVGVDDFSSPSIRPGAVDHHNHVHLRVDETFSLSHVQHLTGGAAPSVIFHLAAMVGVRVAIERGPEVWRRNVAATAGVANFVQSCARRHLPAPTVVGASSSEVYGDSATQPLAESFPLRLAPATTPRQLYVYEKAALEATALALSHEIGCTVMIARLFNTVGPGQNHNYGAVVPAMAEAAVKGAPIPVYVDAHGATTTRSLIHVRDTAAALAHIAKHGVSREIYNVGDGEEVDMYALARIAWEAAGRDDPARIEEIPRPVEVRGCRRRVPDVTKLYATGFTPRHGWQMAVREAIAEAASRHRSEAT